MANFFTSSIGKKLVMSISGMFLMVFLLVHLTANMTSLIGGDVFNAVCHFMSTNILILIMVPVLAAGVFIHFLYALYLTLTNLMARGKERYAVSNKGPATSWASKNMFVLGLIVLGMLLIHLLHFWAKMQLMEFLGMESANPYDLMVFQFSKLYVVIIYIVWFAALWFHLTHGFWSALHTIGLNNKNWMKRLQVLGYIYATVVCAGFCIIPLYFYFIVN